MQLRQWVGVFFIGLLTATAVYPLLHEGGHCLAALLVGGRVHAWQLLPLPCVTCEMAGVDHFGLTLVGLGGMLLPLLFTWLIYLKRPCLRLLGLYLNGICFLSFAISLYACVQFRVGTAPVNEDITKVLMLYPEKANVLMAALAILMAAVMVQVVLARPITHLAESSAYTNHRLKYTKRF